jgi:hypothetical protein
LQCSHELWGVAHGRLLFRLGRLAVLVEEALG